jgi:choice-of-anchor A domain-containing protein
LVAGGQLSLQTGGSAWGNAYDGAGKSISSSATIYGKVIDSTPIGFSDARAKLIKVSGALAAYPSNGSTTIALPNVTFSGSQSSYNVFNIAASELANIRSFAINIPSGASAIINVVNDVPDSTGVVIQNAGFSTNGADPRRIFWNFNGVHKLATASLGFPGSIMAPEAAADIKYGYVDGTLIADSLVSTYTEFHWQPFRGDLPPVTP